MTLQISPALHQLLHNYELETWGLKLDEDLGQPLDWTISFNEIYHFLGLIRDFASKDFADIIFTHKFSYPTLSILICR